jgi:predicted ATPase/class 3 adenylate cyclase
MNVSSLPTGTVTFLFTDIEGSTRLLQTLGRDEYGNLIDEHNRLFRGVLGDAVVSTEGDSFFAVFATPRQAVIAVVDLQRAVEEAPWPGGQEVRVRMGLHTGEGVRGGDNYVGLDVHRAARISAAAHGGQVLISEATRSQVEQALPQGASLADLGTHRLKDLAIAEHLFQLSISGLRGDFPPPNTVEIGPTNLPEHLSSFIGRKHELDSLSEILPGARLVTLVGTGGAGKTRLAIEAARAARAGYPGGVYFAALSRLEDGDLLGAHVASELSISEQVGRSIEATLTDYFQSKQALLVLDNCEHLADAAAGVTERLLRACSDLTVLATSREGLLISGERVFEVGPMAIADDGRESDAVALFTARAAEVATGFDPGRWANECTEICARLDGIPLAIELAAARASVLTPSEIVARLDDRFALLKRRTRSASARHETLEAAIDWSYDLLSEDSRRLLRCLAIFRGGFTLDAAEEIYPDGGSLLDDLTELREKSLLTQEVSFSGSRFGMLETIHEYALTRLHEAGEFEAASRRHRDFYNSVAGDLAHQLGSAEQLEALEGLETDHDNFRAVMRRALDEEDVDSAVDMAKWLVWFWYLHAHFTEGERWAARLLDAVPENPNRSWMRLLIGAAQYDFRLGNYDRAAERLEAALQSATDQKVPRLQMWAHAYISTNELYRSDLESAGREAELALEMANRLGDFLGLAYATFLLISVEAWKSERESELEPGRAEQLLSRLEPVAAGARAAGERNMIGHVMQLVGILSSRVGDDERAAAAFDEAVVALSELGTIGCASHCIEAIAEFAATSDKPEAAAALISATNTLRSDAGITVAPVEEQFRAHAVELFTAALSRDALDAQTATGSSLSLSEAAQLARQTLAQG